MGSYAISPHTGQMVSEVFFKELLRVWRQEKEWIFPCQPGRVYLSSASLFFTAV
jgi:hypothetical protein